MSCIEIMNRIKFLILLLFFSPVVINAQSHSIYGTIRDSISGEVIPNVTISIASQKGGVLTNSYGFYSIKVSKGKNKLLFTHIGYGVLEKEIDVNADVQLDILFVISKPANLQEVVVSANREKLESAGMSRHDLKIETIKKIPSFAGEPDLLKSIHQQHFEEGMREVLAAKKVMKQSLLDVPQALIPSLEAALPTAGNASTTLMLTAISILALATSLLAIGLTLAR